MKNTSPSLAQKASLTFSPDGNEKAPVARGLFFNASEIENSCLSLRFGSGSRHGRHFLASRALNAGSLALQIAQVIQPRAAYFTLANDFNRADRGRVQRENAIEADAKADPAHGKCCTGRPALLGDHHALERLKALLHLLAFTFLQADVDAHGIARSELGEVFAQLRFV